MLFKTAFLALALNCVLFPIARAAQYNVTVGGPGVLKFDPESVTANAGDVVVFSFRQKNHTVTQSTLDNPCELAENGFDSGFVPVADNNTAGPFPEAQYTVEDSNPVWIFCRQANHCQQGMVFAINPGSNLSAFQAAATGNTTSNSTGSASGTSAAVASTVSPAAPSPVNSSIPASPSVVTVTATVTLPASALVSASSVAGSQSGSASPALSTSTDHVVIVGGPNALFFDPANITAEVGDTVTFKFKQTNHTATQSSFADPCVSLTESSTNGEVGFDSGFMPVAADATTFPTYTIQVNNTSSIWAFCKQTNPMSHCGAGMVFSVNAVASGSNNFAAFQEKAIQINGTQTKNSTNAAAGTFAPGRGAGAAVVLLGISAGIFL